MSKSDNFLLTMLGVVGIGAIVMGLNESKNENEIKEDYSFLAGFGFSTQAEKVAVNKAGCLQAINYAKPTNEQVEAIQKAKELVKSGASYEDQVRSMKGIGTQNTKALKTNLSVSAQKSSRLQAGVPKSVEGYENPSLGLGAGEVADPAFVSYPQFQQTIPKQSPSLDLPSSIRYNPPSLNHMGVTDVYQDRHQSSMDHFNMITENYQNPTSAPTTAPSQFMANIQNYPGTNYVANRPDMINQVAKGNTEFASRNGTLIAPIPGNPGCDENADGIIPISTIDSPDGQEVMVYDRLMTVPLKAGWRQVSSGGVDRIRGDLPVCVDPCQSGWFQSSLKPSNLVVGALNNNALGTTNVAELKSQYGGQTVMAGNAQFTPSEIVSLASPSRTSVYSVI